MAVFEHCYLAPLLDAMHAAAPGLPVVYDAHNVEARLKREILAGHPAGAPLCAFVEEVERRLLDAADLVLCCSEADAAHFGPAARQVVLMPHGVIPAAPATPPAGEPPRLGFLGSSHPPNVAAARFIVEELAPRLPEAVFELVGSVCAAVSSSLPNVLLRGVVSEEEKAATLGRWSAALNPVESGSGASLKLADYLAYGLPTVNTPHAARASRRWRRAPGWCCRWKASRPNCRACCGSRRRCAASPPARGGGGGAGLVRHRAPGAGSHRRPGRRPRAHATRAAAAGPWRGGGLAWRHHPGFGRIDLLPEADAVPRPLLADRLLAPGIGAGGEPAVAPRRPCLAYGVGPGGHPVAAEWGLLPRRQPPSGAGTGGGGAAFPAAALRPGRAARCRSHAAGSAGGGFAAAGSALAGRRGPLLLQGSVAGPAALRLRSAGLLLPSPGRSTFPPGPNLWRRRARWLARHAGRYAALAPMRGDTPLPPGLPPLAPVTEAMTLAPAAALLAEAASARHAVAARMALGLEQPFLLVVGKARPWNATLCPGASAVRYADGEASHQDADGIDRRVPMPVAALLLSRDPPCCHLLLGAAPEPLREGLAALAAMAGVPFSAQ
ncbi:hypothetical protein ACFQU7_00045 [Pseudoroseomonas wenyumeiae]